MEDQCRHLRRANKNYTCKDCGSIIEKGTKRWVELSSLPLGNRGIKNIVVSNHCQDCATKKDMKCGVCNVSANELTTTIK